MATIQIGLINTIIERAQRDMDYLFSGLGKMKCILAPKVPPHTDNVYWVGTYVKYVPEKSGGVPVARFIEALKAEGAIVREDRGMRGLHLNKIFQERHGYGKGCPLDCLSADHKVDYTQLDLPPIRMRKTPLRFQSLPAPRKNFLTST